MGIKFSVALCTYNGEKYIYDQLVSIENQTFSPDEIVICDDRSRDGTIDIVKFFAKKSNIPVNIHINKFNLGFSNNFIKCASLCRGDWICFSDQDDVWLPNKIEKINDIILISDVTDLMLICHSADLVNEQLFPTRKKIPNYSKNRIVGRNGNFGFICIPGFTISFKSEILSEINSDLRTRDYFEPTHSIQSHDKWIPMLANSLGSIAYISDSLALYRRHSNTLTGSHQNNAVKDLLNKSLITGYKYYKFQSEVARDCFNCYVAISRQVSDVIKRKYLIDSSFKYSKLSKIFRFRSEIYGGGNFIIRLLNFLKMVFYGGYLGHPFYSHGLFSLFKDIFFLFRMDRVFIPLIRRFVK
jgi:glycosyltransferase involved in cell wall biosynthesis